MTFDRREYEEQAIPKLQRVKCPECGTGEPVPNARELVDEHNRMAHRGQEIAAIASRYRWWWLRERSPHRASD